MYYIYVSIVLTVHSSICSWERTPCLKHGHLQIRVACFFSLNEILFCYAINRMTSRALLFLNRITCAPSACVTHHERILPGESSIFHSRPVRMFDSFRHCLNPPPTQAGWIAICKGTSFIIRSPKFFKVSEPRSVRRLLVCMFPETIDSSDSPSHASLAHDSLTHPQRVRQASAGNQDKQKAGASLMLLISQHNQLRSTSVCWATAI